MKAIMISIKPKWVAKILNGEKTVEIRKTMPKCDLPIDVYIYCTKDRFSGCLYDEMTKKYEPYMGTHMLNGKVVAKFTLNKVEEWDIWQEDLEEKIKLACLSTKEFDDYSKGQVAYAWHISNLVIFDEPKELSEFKKPNTPSYEQTKPFAEMFGEPYTQEEYKKQCERFGFVLTKAPQSWCYVEV